MKMCTSEAYRQTQRFVGSDESRHRGTPGGRERACAHPWRGEEDGVPTEQV